MFKCDKCKKQYKEGISAVLCSMYHKETLPIIPKYHETIKGEK